MSGGCSEDEKKALEARLAEAEANLFKAAEAGRDLCVKLKQVNQVFFKIKRWVGPMVNKKSPKM
jgi:hypothetical protein